MEEFITRHIYTTDYDPAKTWELATWCRLHGANEWTLTTVPERGDRSGAIRHFEEVHEPFRLPTAERRQLTSSRNNSFIRPTPLWRLNSASLVALQEFLPDGLFSYPVSKRGTFEDPVFYRNGNLILGVVSHEREGIVRVTAKECQLMETEGFIMKRFGTNVGY